MKTLNFLEALEANKTRKVRGKTPYPVSSAKWWDVGEMQNQDSWSTAYIVAPWEAEPEKYEFESVIYANSYNYGNAKFSLDLKTTLENYQKLRTISSKCKITIEVLGD